MSRDPGPDGATQPPRPREDGGPLMQRVRIGAIGLAGVFILVLLAASLFGLLGRGAPRAGQTVEVNGAVTVNGAEAPKEPLAELGVAPGNAPDHPLDNGSASPASPQARSAR